MAEVIDSDPRSPRSTPHDRVVCEIPSGEIERGFRWYEIPSERFQRVPDWLENEPTCRLIVSSSATDEQQATNDVARALNGGARYVAFEFCSPSHARDLVARVGAHRATAIVAKHLDAPPRDSAAVRSLLQRMRLTDAAILKVAFPARSAETIALCLSALAAAQRELDRPVSLTPMGTRWGRVAAAAAGSALCFAPILATPGRLSARALLTTLVELDSVAAQGEV